MTILHDVEDSMVHIEILKATKEHCLRHARKSVKSCQCSHGKNVCVASF